MLDISSVSDRIEQINRGEFRTQLAYLLKWCPKCGKDCLETLLCISAGKNQCNCYYEAKDTEKCLHMFWRLIGCSKQDLDALAQNPQLITGVRRVLRVIIKWGIHYPLVIPNTVKWESTASCNLKCIHCIANSAQIIRNELKTEEVFNLIDQCVAIGVINFGIVGGEPLLRGDLFDIIHYAGSKGLRISLSTNATLLNSNIAAKIKKSPVLAVQVSVDGLQSNHDYFRGVIGAFEKTISGIINLLNQKVKVGVTTVVSKHNLHQLDVLVDYLAKIGVNSFTVNEFLPLGRGKQMRNLCLDEADFKAMSGVINRKRKEYQGKLLIRWVGVGNYPGPNDQERNLILLSKCGAGLTELTVEANGDIRPCPFLPSIEENVREKTLEDIWFQSPYLEQYKNRMKLTGKCNGCSYQFSCGGGCRARAEGLLNDKFAPDIRCAL
jgi:radical SAM protein with 4Fe4S-binding SPASM domain